MRIPGQRQQVSSQIDAKNRKVGTVFVKNAKYFNFEDRKQDASNEPKKIVWRKTKFVQDNGQFFIPTVGAFINYLSSTDQSLLLNYVDTVDGRLFDTNLEQYSNIMYSIEVLKNAAGFIEIEVPISVHGYFSLVVDDQIVCSSTTNIESFDQNVRVNIPGGKWTKIYVFYYASSSSVNNRLSVNIDLAKSVENSRIPVPSAISNVGATQGENSKYVELTWDALSPSEVEFYQIFYSTQADGSYGMLVGNVTNLETSYKHLTTNSFQHYFYKMRAITIDGMATDFSTPVEGWIRPDATGTANLEIEFLPNTLVGDQETVGYYTQDELIRLNINSQTSLYGITPSVVMVQQSGENYSTSRSATFVEKRGDTTWNYAFDPSQAGLGEGYFSTYATAAYRQTFEPEVSTITGMNSFTNFRSVGNVVTGFSLIASGITWANDEEFIYGVSCQLNVTGYLDAVNSYPKLMHIACYLGELTDDKFTITHREYQPLGIFIDGNLPVDRTFNFTSLESDTKYSVLVESYLTTGASLFLSAVTPSLKLDTDNSYISDSETISGHFIVDSTAPSFGFVLDGDGVLTQTQDLFTSKLETYVVPIESETYDSGSNVFPTEDGTLYNAGIYQVRYSNDADPYAISGESWINFVGPNYPMSWTLDETDGLKTVYGQLRDRAGNISTTAFDTIFLSSGHIENVVAVQQGYKDYYRQIRFKWEMPTRPDIAGYNIYRKATDITQPTDENDIYDVINSPVVTSYIDIAGGNFSNLEQDTVYSYWITAFTDIGLHSSGYSNRISGYLCDLGPMADKAISSEMTGRGIAMVFSGQSYNTPAGRYATQHDIYMISGDSPTFTNTFVNATQVGVVNNVTPGDRFNFTHIPPISTKYYKYGALARNQFEYTSGDVSAFPDGSFTSGHKISAGAPIAPLWDNASVIGMARGIGLAWYPAAESNITEYVLYRKTGELAGDPTPFPSSNITTYHIPYTYEPNGSDITFVDLRENLPDVGSKYTYWLKAKNEYDEFSLFSLPLVTGLGSLVVLPPVFVAEECYADYGYNHLVLSGATVSEGILAGYKFFRDTDSGSLFGPETLAGTIFEEGTGGNLVTFNDVNIEAGKTYYYAAKAFDVYETESVLAYLGADHGLLALYDFNRLYVNFLENSSFERVDPLDSWQQYTLPGWTGATDYLTSTNSYHGAYAASVATSRALKYDGYILANQAKNYMLSFYAKNVAGSSNTVTGSIVWYSVDRTNVIGASGYSFTITGSNYNRYSSDPDSLLAPAGTTSATLSLANTSVNTILFDSVMFEEDLGEVGVVYPSRYYDSKVLAGDRIMAHTIQADQIAVDAITARKIAANSISGGHIQAGTITFDKLASNPISTYEIDPTLYNLLSATNKIVVNSSPTPKLYFPGGEYVLTQARTNSPQYIEGSWTYNSAAVTGYHYSYYDSATSGHLWFTPTLADAMGSTKTLVSKFELLTNGSYFMYNGRATGPGVQIQGNQITAGFVSADRIDAGTITAVKLAVDSVTADKVLAGAITATKIAAGSVTADKMVIKSSNMLKNSQFSRSTLVQNTPINEISNITDYDLLFSYSTHGRFYRDTSVVFMNPGYTLKYQNDAGTYVFGSYCRYSQWIPVEPSKTYSFGLWLRWNTTPVVTREPKITVYQYDANYNDLSAEIPIIVSTYSVPNDTWYCITGAINSANIQANARYFKFIVLSDNPSQTGTVYKAWYGQLTMCDGNEAITGFASESSTIIDGGYIKTGIIDADKVSISSRFNMLTLESGYYYSKFRQNVTTTISGGLLIAGGDIYNLIEGQGGSYNESVAFRIPKRRYTFLDSVPRSNTGSPSMYNKIYFYDKMGRVNFKSPPVVNMEFISLSDNRSLWTPTDSRTYVKLVHTINNYPTSSDMNYFKVLSLVAKTPSPLYIVDMNNSQVSPGIESSIPIQNSYQVFNYNNNNSASTWFSTYKVAVTNIVANLGSFFVSVSYRYKLTGFNGATSSDVPDLLSLMVYLAKRNGSNYRPIYLNGTEGVTDPVFFRTTVYNNSAVRKMFRVNENSSESYWVYDNVIYVFDIGPTGSVPFVVGSNEYYTLLMQIYSSTLAGSWQIMSASVGTLDVTLSTDIVERGLTMESAKFSVEEA